MIKALDIFARLESGSIVLTANKRLARYLEAEYESRQLAKGVSAWARPLILPFESWCQQQYDLLPDALPVMSRAQGQLVWEQVIAESIRETGHELLQVAPTAEMAWKAEQLLLRYRTSFTSAEASDDQRMFLHWQSAWRKKLAELGMVDAGALPLLLAEAIAKRDTALPREIIFAGFDDIDPAVQHLQQRIASAGCRVVNHQPHYHPDSRRDRLRCPDRRNELRCCAVTVRELLEENPECRVGVVAPNLRLYREQAEQIFRAELDPHGLMSANDDVAFFNISEAPELAREPAVHAALKLLRLSNLVAIDELGALLRSPYLARSETEAFKRAACDRELRRLRRSHLRLDRLGGFLEKYRCDQSFIDLVGHLASFVRDSRTALPGEWAERFSNLLERVGWPGERVLSSTEYQAVERFRRLLGELASLDRVATKVKRTDAVGRLSRLASDIEFQPESGAADVNIVGMLEASGMHFDFLWVLGMHAGAVPAKPHPNPFLPADLQRKLQMPHADAARELVYAENVIARLFACAPTVVASWPQMDEGMPVVMNHFLDRYPDREPAELQSCDPTALVHAAAVPLEKVVDVKAPPVASRKTISGGTSIIRDQAICPFRAFAHHRLRAEDFDEADIGIDAMTRGSLAHKVLELFWEEVLSLEKLKQLPDEELYRKVHSAADRAVNNNRWTLPDGQKHIEVERLGRLCLKWLAVEKQRSEFTVVEREKDHVEQIGRLKIKTVIDRIDRLDNGRLAIIDYKTGRPDPAQWFADRITEPQMPIYCQQIAPDEIDAVAFAVIRPGKNECRFKGIAREGASWPGISDKSQQELMAGRQWHTFDQILENWRGALPELGDAFMDGQAIVDPYDRSKACRYCDLMPLCRLHESDRWSREPDND